MFLGATTTRRGMSLLEVLVAMGILIAGLSGVAALLPSAGSRIAEANAIDRAGALSANAYADILNRRLLSAELFNGVPIGRAIVFGEVLTSATTATISLSNTTELAKRINSTLSVSFQSTDDLLYNLGPTNLPVNSFETANARSFKQGVCYGAMLSPEAFGQPVGSGSAARLTIVVFKKPTNTSQLITLTSTSGVYAITPNDEATRRRFTAGCSSLLVLPANNLPPRFFRIGSSWTVAASSFVAFDDAAALSAYGTPLTAIGFEGLLRSDEQIVTLE